MSVIMLTHDPATATQGLPYDSERLPFSVKVKDEINPYRVLGIYVMPAQVVELECVFTHPRSSFTVSSQAGVIERYAKERWTWKAPQEQGMYPLTITDTTTNSIMTLNVFVMVPFAHNHETLHGYRIGRYQQKPLKNNPTYNRPQGFIEVTETNRSAPVSPHFTLGQFVGKQASGYPKYLLLKERLLLKLEMMLEAFNQEGILTSTLHIMSGFRTPFYNRSIGNQTKYSRHLYGGAADFFVDVDENNYMDDVNQDGKSTITDAIVLADIVKKKARETWYQPFVGGLGIYGPKPHRGPFVHVDVRGFPARWKNP
ncbi:MAG: hypothetical protein NPIRA03_06580 [Nitrospirales bacterium]|nr:MAG: hypothetical protein NPIRA03_06580 [Nitrospirales bacterium]